MKYYSIEIHYVNDIYFKLVKDSYNTPLEDIAYASYISGVLEYHEFTSVKNVVEITEENYIKSFK